MMDVMTRINQGIKERAEVTKQRLDAMRRKEKARDFAYDINKRKAEQVLEVFSQSAKKRGRPRKEVDDEDVKRDLSLKSREEVDNPTMANEIVAEVIAEPTPTEMTVEEVKVEENIKMDSKEGFVDFVIEKVEELKTLFLEKNKQYATSDPLANFRRGAAMRSSCEPTINDMYNEALAYERKHIAHVLGHDVDGPKVAESLRDIAIYSIIELYLVEMNARSSQ